MDESDEAKLPSPDSPENLNEEFVEEPGFSRKRAAYAANYYERCVEFMAAPTLDNLRAVDRALDKVDPADIDVAEAEKLVQKLRPLLDLGSGASCVLWSCQLVVKFQICKPESRWVASADITERAATSFRDVSLALLRDRSSLPMEFAGVIDSWTSLVTYGKLEEHHSYPLITCALQWTFGGFHGWSIRKSFVSFLAATYARLPESVRDQVIHDIISIWSRSCAQSAQSAGAALAELVLSLVAVAGEVSASIWDEAVTTKSRTLIEDESQRRYANAASMATLISRRLIDFTWPTAKTSIYRTEFQRFLCECATLLVSANWPSAELLVSAFVSSLFKLANVVRNHKYASFMFDSIRELHDPLRDISAATHTDDDEAAGSQVSALVCRAIQSSASYHQAMYLSSRQCAMLKQPFFDFHNALQKRKISGADHTISAQDWLLVLHQYPIASYYTKISQMICELASREDLKEQNQVDIFKALENIIAESPALFRPEWLDRLGYATPVVCESLVPLAATMYKHTHDISLLKRLAARINAPGAVLFKKKTLAFLSRAFEDTDGLGKSEMTEVHSLAWRYCLIAATDGDASVRSAAISTAEEWFRNQEGNDVAEVLIQAQKTHESSLVQRGLRNFITTFKNANKNEYIRVQRLVAQLLVAKRLDLALVFIKVDGSFTPLSQMNTLFDMICRPADAAHEQHELLLQTQALQILEAALCARPRIILSPTLTASMFASFVSRLKTATPSQLESLGSILGQLVALGGLQVQQQRASTLEKISDTALKVASSAPLKESALFRQSVLIIGCMQYWGVPVDKMRHAAQLLVSWIDDNLTQPTKLTIIRTVFGLATGCKLLFSEPCVDSLFNSFERKSPETGLFTRLLLGYMWKNTGNGSIKPMHATTYIKDMESFERQRLIGASNGTAEPDSEISFSSMLHKHLARLIALAHEEEDVMILRVVVKAVDDNLLVVDEAIPVITALCFSSKSPVSQTAIRSFVTLCERWPRNFGIKFVEGLKLFGESEASAALTSTPRFGLLRVMWGVMKESSRNRNIKAMIDHLAQLFQHTTSFALLELLIRGLEEVEMDVKDAKLLIVNIEDEVNRFDPSQHSQEETAKMVIIYVFVLWIKRRYGLSESYKISGTSPDEDVEPMQFEEIRLRFTSEAQNAKECLDELWQLPDWYGTAKMNLIIYGKPMKRESDWPEESTKRHQH